MRRPLTFPDDRWIPVIAAIVSMLISMQLILRSNPEPDRSKGEHTSYENYLIFKTSFQHMVDSEDLYAEHTDEHWDLFKYSPTFAVSMGALQPLPDWLGLCLWNLVNILILYIALLRLPGMQRKRAWIFLFITLVEAITSMQNAQSNLLMVGLGLMAFSDLEDGRNVRAALWVSLSVFIKLFGAAFFVWFIFYPNKLRSAGATLLWMALLLSAPLILVGPEELLWQYENWGRMLQNDHDASYGMSVMGWFHSWTGADISKLGTLAFGTVLLLLPLIQVYKYRSLRFRYYMVSSLLLWSVIFNHKAESPTFIIAVAGFALWYLWQKRAFLSDALLSLVILLTVLSSTDLFPPSIREDFIMPLQLKVFPCILVWLVLQWQLWISKAKGLGNKSI